MSEAWENAPKEMAEEKVQRKGPEAAVTTPAVSTGPI